MKVKENPLKDLMVYAGNHKYIILLGRVLAAASALVAMIPYYQIWKIIRIAVDGKNLDAIKGIAWQAVAITITGMLLYIFSLLCTHVSAFRVQANMRISLMNKIIKLPLGVFDSEGTGKIRRIVNDSTEATETFIAHNIPDKAVASATPVGLIALMLIFDWRLGLLCMIPIAIGFVIIMGMMGKNMQEKMAEYQGALETMSNEGVEYVRGIPVVKTFGQTVFTFKRFKNAIDNYAKWASDYTVMLRPKMVKFIVSINAVFVAVICASYAFSLYGVTPKLIQNVMYYIIISPLLTLTMTKLAYSGEQEMIVVDALQRVNSILKMEALSNYDEKKSGTDKNDISIENVTFRYDGAKNDALHNLNIRIESGKHVALVGPSGGGKTTTAELIARFFDVTSGSIKIGGVNVKEFSQEELMKKVSFVFQDSKLLKTSVLENVRLSRPDATEEEVTQALINAQCEDILQKLPDGINTVIGTKGVYLSGGEMQRISIARSFLKNSPIIILDEATAFADPDNENKVQTAFEKLAAGKTVIMIAHRLSTVLGADEIFVLKNGECVENGTHSELVSKNGLYAKMWKDYEKSVEWKVGA